VKLLLQRLDPPLQGGHLPLEKFETPLHLFPLHPFVSDKPLDAPNALQNCLVFLLQSFQASVDVLQVPKDLAESLVHGVEALVDGRKPLVHGGKAFVYRVELPPQEGV